MKYREWSLGEKLEILSSSEELGIVVETFLKNGVSRGIKPIGSKTYAKDGLHAYFNSQTRLFECLVFFEQSHKTNVLRNSIFKHKANYSI